MHQSLAFLALFTCLPQAEPAAIPALDLTIDFSAFVDLQGEARDQGYRKGHWTGSLDGAKLVIDLLALDRKTFDNLNDPADVARVYAFNRGNEERKNDRIFDFEVSRPLEGSFGELPYGWLSVNERYEGTKLAGHEIIISGLVPTHGYMLEVISDGPLEDSLIDAIGRWAATGVKYGGEPLDPSWTEDEVEARWKSGAPEPVYEKGRRQIIRTKYYIIFTDLGRGTAGAFGKKVDENYEKVRDVFPFDDVAGQRLLPIFYFTQRDHYIDWWVKNLGGSRESAERSGGVASGDVYSTYHQSVNASVHIHEQTHQIFRNRLRLSGGGSWFQEGVAEYMASRPGDLGQIKRHSQKEGALAPFEKFMVVPSLLMSSEPGSRKEGGSNSGLAYTYAAAIIEFAKHSEFGREKFLDWVHAIGRVGRGDLPAIRRVTSRTYGVSLEEFEQEFRAYWKKRRSVRDWHAPAESAKKRRGA